MIDYKGYKTERVMLFVSMLALINSWFGSAASDYKWECFWHFTVLFVTCLILEELRKLTVREGDSSNE